MDSTAEIRLLDRRALAGYLEESLPRMGEEEALAVLANPHCTAAICRAIGHSPRLTLHYPVRLRLVGHRATPQGQALKFVNHLYWADLLRLSVTMHIAPPVRRAIDVRLATLLPALTLGERIAAAKRCSRDLIGHLLFDPEPRVFSALMINPRLVEDDLIRLISSERVLPEKLGIVAADRKWSCRYAIRMALVLNSATPRSVAAGQLRYLNRQDLSELYERPGTSTYIRRCIESLRNVSTGERPGGKELLQWRSDE